MTLDELAAIYGYAPDFVQCSDAARRWVEGLPPAAPYLHASNDGVIRSSGFRYLELVQCAARHSASIQSPIFPADAPLPATLSSLRNFLLYSAESWAAGQPALEHPVPKGGIVMVGFESVCRINHQSENSEGASYHRSSFANLFAVVRQWVEDFPDQGDYGRVLEKSPNFTQAIDWARTLPVRPHYLNSTPVKVLSDHLAAVLRLSHFPSNPSVVSFFGHRSHPEFFPETVACPGALVTSFLFGNYDAFRDAPCFDLFSTSSHSIGTEEKRIKEKPVVRVSQQVDYGGSAAVDRLHKLAGKTLRAHRNWISNLGLWDVPTQNRQDAPEPVPTTVKLYIEEIRELAAAGLLNRETIKTVIDNQMARERLMPTIGGTTDPRKTAYDKVWAYARRNFPTHIARDQSRSVTS